MKGHGPDDTQSAAWHGHGFGSGPMRLEGGKVGYFGGRETAPTAVLVFSGARRFR